MKIRRLVAGLLLAVGLAAGETGEATLVLKDASRIVGTVVSLADGVYQVKTVSLGTLSVPAASVARIEYGAPEVSREAAARGEGSAKERTVTRGAPAGGMALSGPAERLSALLGFEQILRALTADAGMMEEVRKLAEDPAFAAVMDDPGVRKAIEDGNFAGLAANPKIWTLLNHPTVKSIAGKVKGQGTGDGGE